MTKTIYHVLYSKQYTVNEERRYEVTIVENIDDLTDWLENEHRTGAIIEISHIAREEVEI